LSHALQWVEPTGQRHSQTTGQDSAIALSSAPYFENVPHPGSLPYSWDPNSPIWTHGLHLMQQQGGEYHMGVKVLTCYVKVWKSRRFSIQEWFCQSKWLNWKKPANGYPKESSSPHFEWPASLYKCKMWSYLVCSCWIVAMWIVVHGNWRLCVLENTQYRP